MTEVQKKFVELDKKKTEMKKFYEEYNQALAAVISEIGIGEFFQDEDGTVYKTCVPAGTYVEFRQQDILRTRRLEEKKGSLSLIEAKEAGFAVR